MDSVARFNGKSSDYSKYRPDYPPDLLSILTLELGLGNTEVIADVGAGTGKLSKAFLENGHKVFCIEPNPEMREKAREDLSNYKNVSITEGTAEDTGLEDSSVDIIVAGQAFHWFDREKSKNEFRRILKENGSVVLVWNDRVETAEGINGAYEKVCKKYSKDYHSSGSSTMSYDEIKGFFDEEVRRFAIPNPQRMTLEGLTGRYFSASYAVDRDTSDYRKVVRALERAFKEHKVGDHVSMEYTTRVFAGKLKK